MQDLQSRNERMFLLTFLVLNTADSQRQLANNVFQASSIAQKHNCQLTRLDFQQEEGLMSSLPLGYNQIEIQRGLDDLKRRYFCTLYHPGAFQDGKEALYYGLNALSNNLIMVDRKLLKNPNGLILGTPGSGKSFSAKREISNVFLVTNDDVLICDPEDEYAPLVIRLGGQVVKISPTSNQYVNPMDINLNYSDDDNPLALKADFILSCATLWWGSKDGLQPVEKTVIDRAVRNVYRPYLADPDPEKMPILQDLYDELLRQRAGGQARGGGLGAVCDRLPQCVQPPYQCGAGKPAGVLQYQGTRQTIKTARYAGHPGPGVEPRHRQPGGWQDHPLLLR